MHWSTLGSSGVTLEVQLGAALGSLHLTWVEVGSPLWGHPGKGAFGVTPQGVHPRVTLGAI